MKIVVQNATLAASLGVKVGEAVEVPDRKGVPLDRFWRNRLRDASLDDCVHLPQNKPSTKTKRKTVEEA